MSNPDSMGQRRAGRSRAAHLLHLPTLELVVALLPLRFRQLCGQLLDLLLVLPQLVLGAVQGTCNG